MATTVKITTPKGELEWVTITGEGKENMSGKLQYVASIVLDPENEPTHQEVIDKIKAFWDENKPAKFSKEPKSLGVYPHTIPDPEGETDEEGKVIRVPTGKYVLTFKTGTTFPDGSAKKVKVYNSKAKLVELGDKKVGNGSVGEIAGAMGIYTNMTPNGKTVVDAGVTLYLDAIKISKFVEFSVDAGFAADEDDADGWTGEDEGWAGEDEGNEAPKAGPRL